MTNLTPASSLDDVIQHETSTLVLGGPGQPMNQQAQALLNRTAFLNDKIDGLQADDIGFLGRSIAEAFNDMIHITYFASGNLAADGVTDWQSVFDAAAASTFSSIFVPDYIMGSSAKYLLSSGNVDVTGKKFWSLSTESATSPYGTRGATIYTTQTTNPVFSLGTGGSIDGLQFFYPNQDGSTITDVSGYPTIVGAPIVYAPTIKGKTAGISEFEIRNVTFINSYHCIELGDPGMSPLSGTGGGTISNIFAFAIKHFLTLYRGLAEIIISDFVISPLVYQDVALTGQQKLHKWAQQNSEHLVLNRADGLMVSRGTILGSNVAIHTAGEFLSLARFDNVLFDNVRTVSVDDIGWSDVTFTNCHVYGNTRYPTLETPADLFVFQSPTSAASFGPVLFNGCTVQTGLRSIFKLATANCLSRLDISDCQMLNWAAANGTVGEVPAIHMGAAATGTRVSVKNPYMLNSYVAGGVGVNAEAGALIELLGGSFRNMFTTIKTAVGVLQVRIKGNSSENNVGTTDLVLAGASVSERGNNWSKPATVKVSTDPWFIGRQAVGQTITGATTVIFGTELRDGDLSYNNATGVFTCKTPGAYQFEAQVSHGGETAGDVFVLQLVTTLANWQSRFTMLSTPQTVNIGATVEMRVGDTAEVKLQRISGAGDFTTSGTGSENYFTGRLID